MSIYVMELGEVIEVPGENNLVKPNSIFLYTSPEENPGFAQTKQMFNKH